MLWMIKLLLLHPAVITRPTFFNFSWIEYLLSTHIKYINIVESRGYGRAYISSTAMCSTAPLVDYDWTQTLLKSNHSISKCKSTHS